MEPRRRPSEFFVPVARPRKASAAQLTMDQFGGPTKQQPNEIVNEIHQSVASWRLQDYPHVTSTTRDLLSQWRDEDGERRLFFCQIEAAETAIYLTEAAEKTGDTKALNVIRAENEALNGGLPQMAFKMPTGSGKTVVMAMLICWQALNKQANPQDRWFTDKVPDRHAGHRHPRPTALAAAQRPSGLLHARARGARALEACPRRAAGSG